jgi:hypothetical protein
MIVGNGVHAVEAAQVVLVRHVVAVPSHHVERRELLRVFEQLAPELHDVDELGTGPVLKCSHRGLEV